MTALAGGLTCLAGCRAPDPITPDGSVSVRRVSAGTEFGFTHLRRDGNRRRSTALRGPLPDDPIADIEVSFPPVWVVGVPTDRGSLWTAVGPDGTTYGFRIDGTAIAETTVRPGTLPAGTPPMLAAGDPDPTLITPPSGASRLTHPFVLADGRVLWVAENGDVVLRDGSAERRQGIDALPDARIVAIDAERVAVLGDATRRYPHGALGDELEAGSIAVLRADERLELETRITPPGDRVVEAIAPIVADLTDDGTPDIVVSEADPAGGAREAVYTPAGDRLATGPAVGTGFRWRHQLAVGPFLPDGQPELAVVRTPHIGGILEFYRPRSDGLEITATLEGYSSHAIGSRNLDGGLAADCDGDGRLELLVPDQPRTALAGIRRTDRGATEAWRVPVGGTLTSNVVAVPHAGDRLAVGVGRRDGTVRLWA